MSPQTIVFIGDSITDHSRRADPAGLGYGYVRLVAADLASRGDSRRIVNTGISGDRVVDLRARWADDALAYAPSTLSVYIGVNDAWRRFDFGDLTRAEDFEACYRSLLTEARDKFAPRLILVEPFLVPVTRDQQSWGALDLDAKRAAVRSLAAEFDATLVPLHSILTAAAQQHGPKEIADDGVHPTPLGSRLIADAWLAAEASR